MNVDIKPDQQNEPGLQHVYMMLLKASGLKEAFELVFVLNDKNDGRNVLFPFR